MSLRGFFDYQSENHESNSLMSTNQIRMLLRANPHSGGDVEHYGVSIRHVPHDWLGCSEGSASTYSKWRLGGSIIGCGNEVLG